MNIGFTVASRGDHDKFSTGFPDMGMLPYGSNKKLSDEQLLQVASYVISKKGSSPAEPKEIDPAREVVCPPAGGAPTASK